VGHSSLTTLATGISTSIVMTVARAYDISVMPHMYINIVRKSGVKFCQDTIILEVTNNFIIIYYEITLQWNDKIR
jgi:hypothetical protein